MVYFFIFISKIIENAISTLRLILVANGKKFLGAILNLIISLIWIISTSLVIIDIQNDYFKIVVFIFGSFLGSYVGSLIEEKIAIGSNMLFLVSKKEIEIKNCLDKLNYNSYIINDDILIIMVDRKKRKDVLNIVKNIDNDVIIISEVAKELIFK
ncbi:MAG: hypothetical protein E7170_00355 [Firmicutes bacterium]|nr:hypothetical protein [Bacillota bacterium]